MTATTIRTPVATCQRIGIGPLRLRLYRTPGIGTRLVAAFVTRGDDAAAREETSLATDFHSDHLARLRAKEVAANAPQAQDSTGKFHDELTGEWGGQGYSIPAAKLAAIADYDARNAEISRLRRAGEVD